MIEISVDIVLENEAIHAGRLLTRYRLSYVEIFAIDAVRFLENAPIDGIVVVECDECKAT